MYYTTATDIILRPVLTGVIDKQVLLLCPK